MKVFREEECLTNGCLTDKKCLKCKHRKKCSTFKKYWDIPYERSDE